jgi:hypothetical protein
MIAMFSWLTNDNNWPVMVCLQGILHNWAAHAVEKSTRKVVNTIAGVALLLELHPRNPRTSRKCMPPLYLIMPSLAVACMYLRIIYCSANLKQKLNIGISGDPDQ